MQDHTAGQINDSSRSLPHLFPPLQPLLFTDSFLALVRMDSLPPELISTIIEHAATCASTEESYRLRLDALSSLALVNRNLHRFAQPLLAQKVIVRSSKGWLSSKNPEFKAAIKSLTHHNLEVLPLSPLVSPYEFAGLRELRLIDWCVHISELGSLPRE